jgi:hypothetical protein
MRGWHSIGASTAVAGSGIPFAATLTGSQAARAFQASAPLQMDTNISEEQVLQAQRGWCKGLLAISEAFAKGGFSKAKATATANQVLD